VEHEGDVILVNEKLMERYVLQALAPIAHKLRKIL
jgi:hypothetical protein